MYTTSHPLSPPPFTQLRALNFEIHTQIWKKCRTTNHGALPKELHFWRLDPLLSKVVASSANMIGRRSTYTRKGKKVMFPLQPLV
jgi:hypothetical protein